MSLNTKHKPAVAEADILSKVLSFCQQVPALVGDNTALTNLDLGGNKIIGLPDTLNSLSSLTVLDLSNNNLETVSILPLEKDRGMRLVSLEVLRLENNSLTEGPAAVETLTGLTELK